MALDFDTWEDAIDHFADFMERTEKLLKETSGRSTDARFKADFPGCIRYVYTKYSCGYTSYLIYSLPIKALDEDWSDEKITEYFRTHEPYEQDFES